MILTSDLQNSRYLYLGACAWFGLVAYLISSAQVASVRRAFAVAAVAFIALSTWSVRTGLRHWQDAGVHRDFVIDAVERDPAFAQCSALTLRELPDNVRGAYLFRVEMPEYITSRTDKPVVSNAPPECTLTWKPERRGFVKGS